MRKSISNTIALIGLTIAIYGAMALQRNFAKLAFARPSEGMNNLFQVVNDSTTYRVTNEGVVQSSGLFDRGFLQVNGTSTLQGNVVLRSSNATTNGPPQILAVVRNASGGTLAAGSVVIWASSASAFIASTNTFAWNVDVTTTGTRNDPLIAGIMAGSTPAGSTGTMVISGFVDNILTEEAAVPAPALLAGHQGARIGTQVITSTKPAFGSSYFGTEAIWSSTFTVHGIGTWLSTNASSSTATRAQIRR